MNRYRDKYYPTFEDLTGLLFSVFISVGDIDDLEGLFILRGVGIASFEGSENDYDLFCRAMMCSEHIFTELRRGNN